MNEATRKVLFRDFLIFQLKLLLDGAKDLVLLNVSVVALVLDFVAGGGRRPRLFYSVLRQSERFDAWLNLNGALEELDAPGNEDGLFGASRAGSDTLLGKLEQMVRGGDGPGEVRPPPRPERAGSDAADVAGPRGGTPAPEGAAEGPSHADVDAEAGRSAAV